ncbi:hypothetical protein MRB53_026072 [Persea americana]|uniref:Uncharacterized protein n=1 Tax=Persea americana TaxID=3435 RepID=A0ACC2LHN7_PERAE|nr:hypothetical protein MRB53_026072 [Persea americana]
MVAQSDDFVNIIEQMQHKATTKSEKKPFKLPNNSITKLFTKVDKKKLKLIYDTEGYKLNCGIIVCYIMTQIARCKTVHNHLVQRVVNSFSAELAVKFLHDEPRSWTKEDFEAKKFASLKEG